MLNSNFTHPRWRKVDKAKINEVKSKTVADQTYKQTRWAEKTFKSELKFYFPNRKATRKATRKANETKIYTRESTYKSPKLPTIGTSKT